MENNRCVVCEQTLRGRRRHVLNEHFIQIRPNFREHISQEIQFNGTRSICNACWHSINRRLNQVQPPDVPPPAADNNCVSCQHSLRRRRRHILNIVTLQVHRDIVEYILRDFQPPQEIPLDGSRAVCHVCWCRISAIINEAAPPPVAVPRNSIMVPGLTRAANTSRRCMIMHCNNQQLRAMSNATKMYLLSYFRLYVPKRARICHQHLRTMSPEEFPRNIVHQESDINAESVLDIINIYTSAVERRSSLNIEEMTNDDFIFWFGISREHFNILLDQVPTLHNRSKSPKVDLAVFLCKLRNGEPNNRIGSLFNCSKYTIGRKIRLARSCLTHDFVPLHMGLDHITRDDTIERNRILPNYIFGNMNNEDNPRSIIILDGTYLFTEKSTNFLFQRVSYSLHKYRNLIKPFMIVCGDGYILDITGPYPATTNDADILKMILNNHGDPIEECAWHYFFHQNDVMVLDRGFRDAIPQAEEYGYEVHMPPSNSRGQRQLSTEESNKSRLVTICRWVVEAINGRMKRDFKLFRHRVFNRDLPHIYDDFKIAGAIINCFQEPFEDSAYTEEFCLIIRLNMHKPNLLADYVEEHNLNQQRVPFVRLEATSEEVNDFPRLTYEDLIMISVGSYHPKIARSYCSEHINRTGVFEIEFYRHSEEININNEENNALIRSKIQSRHVRSKIYRTNILYNSRVEGRYAIKEYCCTCIHGRRTLGVCAHVMTILYYLGWARYEDGFSHPAHFLDNILLDVEQE